MFLGQDQKVSDRIYPVLLYYREAHVLILAYGISETNPPTVQWNGLDQPRAVATYNLDAPWWAVDQEIRSLMG
jgi:5-methylcytosine-specific restriction protein B